jgi:septum formation inhibitor-activating ATPase MinD
MMIHIMKRLSIDIENKVQIVLNRLSPHSTLSPGRIEEFLQRKIKGVLPEEDGLVCQSILHGNPVVMDKRSGPFGQELQNLITTLELGVKKEEEFKESASRRSMIDNIRSLIFERKDHYGRRA